MKIAAPTSHSTTSGESRSIGESIGTGANVAPISPWPRASAPSETSAAVVAVSVTGAGSNSAGRIQPGSVTGGSISRASGRNHSA